MEVGELGRSQVTLETAERHLLRAYLLLFELMREGVHSTGYSLAETGV